LTSSRSARFETEMQKYVESMNPKLLDAIMQKKTLDDA